jgi:hypothetical protein
LKEKNDNIRIVASDVQSSSLFNKVKFNVMFTHEEKEGKVNKNPIYTII